MISKPRARSSLCLVIFIISIMIIMTQVYNQPTNRPKKKKQTLDNSSHKSSISNNNMKMYPLSERLEKIRND